MITVETGHPLAAWTADHQYPRGTMLDSSTEPEFVRRLLDLIPDCRLLDLGCAGGGLVGAMLDAGTLAVGIEGSDYSQVRGRAEWARLSGTNLFTADITEPFRVMRGRIPVQFDVVTMWEVLEHIPQDKLAGVAGNIRRHLVPGGLLIASIATCSDFVNGVEYHATQQNAVWWLSRLAAAGFAVKPELAARFEGHWVRGPNKGESSSLCVVAEAQPEPVLPMVSVVTPTHLRHRLLLERCIPSVQAQDYKGRWEQIIVSGPDPELAGMARYWNPEHIRYHEMDENVADGGATPRRIGCELARGDLICYLDDDVAYRPDHISKLVTAMTGGADFAFSMMQTWHGSQQGHVIGTPPPRHGTVDTSLIMNRPGLLNKATWEKVTDGRDGRPGDPDGDLVNRWMALGVTWAYVPDITVDYWFGEAGGSRQ